MIIINSSSKNINFIGNAVIGLNDNDGVISINNNHEIINFKNNTIWSERGSEQYIIRNINANAILNFRLNIISVRGSVYGNCQGIKGYNVYMVSNGLAPSSEIKSRIKTFENVFFKQIKLNTELDVSDIIPYKGIVKNVSIKFNDDKDYGLDVTGTVTSKIIDAGCIQTEKESGRISIESFRWLPYWVKDCSIPHYIKTLNLYNSPNRNRKFEDIRQIIIPPIGGMYNSSYVVSVRLVVPTYGGPCLRVRRSSDNSEKDILFYGGWVDEAELLAFVGSGNGFVTAWYNQTPQYGAGSFTNGDVLLQPQIVSSGNVIRAGGSGRPAVLFVSTGKKLYAPGGAYWLTASNNGMFMSAVSSSTIGSPGSLTRSLFGQDMPDGNSPAYISRHFTLSEQAHKAKVDLSIPDIKTNDSSVYPTSPLTDTSVSASRSGSVRIYARGSLNTSAQVTFPNRTGWTLKNTVIGMGAGVTDTKIFEIIAQSQAFSESYQIDLSQNQMLAFGIPGVY